MSKQGSSDQVDNRESEGLAAELAQAMMAGAASPDDDLFEDISGAVDVPYAMDVDLFNAVQNDNEASVRSLLASKADPDTEIAEFQMSARALAQALESPLLDLLVSSALEQSPSESVAADPVPTVSLEQQLLEAVQGGNAHQAYTLMAAGANPDRVIPEMGMSVRTLADMIGASDLLQHPVVSALAGDPAPANGAFERLAVAIDTERLDPLKQCLAGMSAEEVDTRDSLGCTALMYAAAAPSQEGSQLEAMVQALLDHKADPNAQDDSGSTALSLLLNDDDDVEDATWVSVDSLISLLLSAKADVNLANEDGVTPVMLAAGKKNPLYLKQLLSVPGVETKGACRVTGNTAVYQAIYSGNEESLRRLLDAGAPCGAPNHAGLTPLMVAAQFGMEDMVRALLAHGVDTSVGGKRNALALARDRGHASIVDQIEAHEAAVKASSSQEVEDFVKAHADDAEALIRAESAVSVEEDDEAAAFIMGAYGREIAALEQLHEAGGKQTALMSAAGCGAQETLQSLLDHKADVSLQDKFGLTALHYAVLGVEAADEDQLDAAYRVVMSLCLAKANPRSESRDGETPLQRCSDNPDLYDLVARFAGAAPKRHSVFEGGGARLGSRPAGGAKPSGSSADRPPVA